MKLVPDTSVVVDGRVSAGVSDGTFAGATVLVPNAVVAELESQANHGQERGWDGLAELKALVALADDGEIDLEYVGRRPSANEIRGADDGEIDALIRDVAAEHAATLVTSDAVQAEVAGAMGLPVEYVAPEVASLDDLGIDRYFDDTTMSVHLRVGMRPMAKRGEVGDMHYQVIGEEAIEEDTIAAYTHEVLTAAAHSPDGFVEIDEPGMKIVQLGDRRIAIAEPPFSDAAEITVVRPIVKTSLDDYAFADELTDRLLERQRGVLIAGSPGAGKSTFAQAVAEFLASHDNAVKTMEKPRDLQVGPEITQYTALSGSMAKTADSLLMVRPDYTIYDEVRKTSDFEVFADMRLAGVGMVGVVHATRAVDALQRLIGRVELGMIPQIVDTVVFIEDGAIERVYDVDIEVKVPQGLMEEDLARPVITVRNFETGTPEYEIYTFNRQVVTIPLKEDAPDTGVSRIAKQEIEREIRSIARGHVAVELESNDRAIVYVEPDDISTVIGKNGGRISGVEDRLGISIDVRTFDERPEPEPTQTATGSTVVPDITNRNIVIPVEGHVGDTVEVRADGEYLFTATVGRGGDIQVTRGSAIAEELESAIDNRRTISIVSQ